MELADSYLCGISVDAVVYSLKPVFRDYSISWTEYQYLTGYP